MLVKIRSKIVSALRSPQVGFFLFFYGMEGVMWGAWRHSVFAMVINCLTILGATAVVVLTVRKPDVVNITLAPGFSPDVVMDIDDRLATLARNLGRDPTSDELMGVVKDLRSIVRDLGPS